MAGKKHPRPSGDRGAQAVEFALVWVAVLGPVLYALIAFGLVMSDQIAAAQMAREIARSYAICAAQAGATANSRDTAAAAQLSNTENSSWVTRSPSVKTDQASTGNNCFVSGATMQSVIVSVKPVLAVPFVSYVQGKATTPCGG